MQILEEEFRAAASRHGVVDEVALALDLVSRVVERLGGEYVYIPRKASRDRVKMYEQIIKRFDGRNASILARDYGLSVRHVRRILNARHP